jgi:hypothetical protein
MQMFCYQGSQTDSPTRLNAFLEFIASSLIGESEISNQGDRNQAAVLEAGIS